MWDMSLLKGTPVGEGRTGVDCLQVMMIIITGPIDMLN